MSDKVALFVTLWAAPGRADALLAELEAMLPVVRDEPGTLAYGFHKVSGDRGGVCVYEVYQDADAQARHGASPASEALKARLPGLLASAPERFDLMPVGGARGLPF